MKSTCMLVFFLFGSYAFGQELPSSIQKPEYLRNFVFGGNEGHSFYTSGDTYNPSDWEIIDRWNICEDHNLIYRIESCDGNKFIINMIYQPGGSGTFTSLSLLEITNDSIKLLESLAVGDRCQFGVRSEEVKMESGYLVYSQLITPYLLMSWFNHDLPHDSYDDCMICCIGAAKFKYDPISRKGELVGIELLLENLESEDSFARVYNLYKKNNKSILTESELREFINLVQ